MPWLGFFDKIGKADLWIVLDHVTNNPRDAAFWGRRVRILGPSGPQWLSIPLARPGQRGLVGVPIREMQVNAGEAKQLQRALNSVRAAYARFPHFSRYFSLVERFFADEDASLVKRNMAFIEAVLKELGITTRVVYSSDYNITSSSTHMLADLLEAVGATTYVCGQGARDYQDDSVFAERKIEVRYNTFAAPEYPQATSTSFVPGLSIIDPLFSVGGHDVAQWLAASRTLPETSPGYGVAEL